MSHILKVFPFIQKVSEKIIEADETIPELPVKDVVSRGYVSLLRICYYHLHRYSVSIEVCFPFRMTVVLSQTSLDVRFSKDPTPYKVSKTHSPLAP